MGIVPTRKHTADHQRNYTLAVHYPALFGAGLLVLLAYLFFVSVGRWTQWPTTTNYYDRLATAFRGGHLYLPDTPKPALLALPNPYDAEARGRTPGLGTEQLDSIWDTALYDGKIYLYWGPAPALLLDGLKLVYSGSIGDQQLTFGFLSGLFVFQSLILFRLWRRFFPSSPTWTVLAGILLGGFLNPVPWLLFSPRIYEAAIAAGQFFLIGGLFFVFTALDMKTVSRWRLLLAGALWVCAVGSRATLAVPVVFLASMVLLWLLRNESAAGTTNGRVKTAAAFFLPLLAGALLLAWHNFARFGSIFEFGFRYEITMLDQNAHRDILFSPIYLSPNSYLYLLNSPGMEAAFPFVRPIWNQDLVSTFNAQMHGIYNAERMIGLVFVAPFLFFALLSPIFAVVIWSRRRRTGSLPASALPEPDDWNFLSWLIFTLAGAAVLGLLVVFLVFYATMRYFMDVTPILLILSMLGLWLGYGLLEMRPVWRVAYVLIAAVLIIATMVMGVLTGFSSDVPRIRAANPALLVHIRLFFVALAGKLLK
jgi:hypothetical protein